MSDDDDGCMYHVMRHTDNRHTGGEQTEVQGSYWTLEEANDAARVDLTNEMGKDFFEEYTEEEDDEDGTIRVEARCPEGEIISVYVETGPAPPQRSAPKSRPSPKDVRKQFQSDHIWIIMATTTKHPKDKEGKTFIGKKVAYEAVLDANNSARDVLKELCYADSDEEEETDIEELQEENSGSRSKPYSATAFIYDGARHSVKVKVQKMKLRQNSKRKRAAERLAGGRRKRARVDAEDVVVISD